MLRLGKTFEFGDRKITDQDCCTFRWFPANTFVNITDTHVYGPCLFFAAES